MLTHNQIVNEPYDYEKLRTLWEETTRGPVNSLTVLPRIQNHSDHRLFATESLCWLSVIFSFVVLQVVQKNEGFGW